MAQNVLTGLMQGYQWADDMQRRDTEDKRQERLGMQAEEDRGRRLTREAKTDEYADLVTARQKQEFERADRIRSLSAVQYKVESGLELTPEDRKLIDDSIDEPTRRTLDRFGTPEKATEALGHIDNLFSAISGEGGDYQGAIDSANFVLGDYVNRGEGGTEKRIKHVLPSKSGRGFYLDLEMKDKDGKYKVAPMTAGRGTADTDEVKEVDGAELLRALGYMSQSIESQLVALGDPGVMKRIEERKKSKAELAKEERKFKRDLELEKIKAGRKGSDLKTFGSPETGYFSFDPATQKTTPLVAAGGGKPEGGAVGYGKLPAEAQLVEYYKNVLGMTYDEAAQWVKNGKGNPADLAIKLYGELAGNPMNRKMSDDELRQQAVGAANFFFEAFGATRKKPDGSESQSKMASHDQELFTGKGTPVNSDDPYPGWSQPKRGADGQLYRVSPDSKQMIPVAAKAHSVNVPQEKADTGQQVTQQMVRELNAARRGLPALFESYSEEQLREGWPQFSSEVQHQYLEWKKGIEANQRESAEKQKRLEKIKSMGMAAYGRGNQS